ncbi:MAG: CvpA family protein [Lachnospira sp.]
MLILIIILLLGILTLYGYKKGIISIAVSLVSMIVTLVLATIVVPVMCRQIKMETDVDEKLANTIYESLIDKEEVSTYLEDAEYVVDLDNEDIKDTSVKNYLEIIGQKANLPESIVNTISNTSFDEIGKDIESYAQATAKEIVLRIFSARMADIIISAIVYCVVFIVIFVLLRVIAGVTGIVSKLPIIHQANKAGGAALGFVEGLIAVWLFFALLTAMGSSSFALDMMDQIHNNAVLEFLYNNNLVLKLIFKFI